MENNEGAGGGIIGSTGLGGKGFTPGGVAFSLNKPRGSLSMDFIGLKTNGDPAGLAGFSSTDGITGGEGIITGCSFFVSRSTGLTGAVTSESIKARGPVTLLGTGAFTSTGTGLSGDTAASLGASIKARLPVTLKEGGLTSSGGFGARPKSSSEIAVSSVDFAAV